MTTLEQPEMPKWLRHAIDDLQAKERYLMALDDCGFLKSDTEGGVFLGHQICEAAGVEDAAGVLAFVTAKSATLDLEAEYASVYRRLIGLSESSPNLVSFEVIHKSLETAASVLAQIAHNRCLGSFGNLSKVDGKEAEK